MAEKRSPNTWELPWHPQLHHGKFVWDKVISQNIGVSQGHCVTKLKLRPNIKK